MTAGWRSPLGGPRYDGDDVPEPEPIDWDEVYRESRGPEATIEEAHAVAGPDVTEVGQ